jgi:hypothetical protein
LTIEENESISIDLSGVTGYRSRLLQSLLEQLPLQFKRFTDLCTNIYRSISVINSFVSF